MIYRSEQVPWVSNNKKIIPLDFLQPFGPKGGRNVIEKIILQATLNTTTPGGVSIGTQDLSSYVKRVRVWDRAGNRRYFTGQKARLKHYLDLGIAAPPDPAAHPAATTQSDTVTIALAFAQPKARRSWDYAMPVEDLLYGGGIEIEMPAVSDLLTTGGAATSINSGTYQAFVYVREEFSMEFKMRDVVEEFAQPSVSNFYVPVGNRLVREVVIFTDGAGGGVSLANLTDITIEPYNIIALAKDLFRQQYMSLYATSQVANVDPVFGGLALPVIFPLPDMKFSDFQLFSGQILIRATSTLAAAPNLLCHYITMKDPGMMAAAAARNRVGKNARLVVQTAEGDKTRSLSQWGPLAKFAPLKVAA